MIFELLKLNLDVPDAEFDSIYSERIRRLSRRHWTSVATAKRVSEFLAEKPGTKVLDIGSGVGKFCMVAAAHTKGYFVGVEQRGDLVEISNTLATSYDIKNVKFIHANITSIQFRNYDAFYFFNSFHENVATYGQIDSRVDEDLRLYDLYTLFTYQQFSSLPAGTRIVTYHSCTEIIPPTFRLVYSLEDDLLEFWEKIA
jgi:SAM-dependent methyltransferase